MAERRSGDRFTCTLGVVKTHFVWFSTDLGRLKIFEILTFFENFRKFWRVRAGVGGLAIRNAWAWRYRKRGRAGGTWKC